MAVRKIIILDLEVNLQSSPATGAAKAIFWLVAPQNRIRPQGASFKSAVPTATTYPAWAATTAKSVGNTVIPTTANGFAYNCTVAGTTGSAQPTFPTTPGATVTDGTVTWICDNVDQNSGITATELAMLQAGLLVEVSWISQQQQTLANLQTEIQAAYNQLQTNLNQSAFSSRLYLESWDGTTWSAPL